MTNKLEPFQDPSSFSLLRKTLADPSGSSRPNNIEDLFKSAVARGLSSKAIKRAQKVRQSVGDIGRLYKENETSDSLADANTLWEDGTRKSSRLKSRSLEYRREATDSSNQPSENQHVSPNTNNEHQVAFQTPLNKLRKQKASPRPRKRKNNNESQSLAGASTLWEDGIRKSSRLKSRSLEYQREATDISSQPLENQHVSPDTDNEHQVAFQTPLNKLRKQKASPRPQKRKNNKESQILAGASTSWEDDRRKSSRLKSRSLEYRREATDNSNQPSENQHVSPDTNNEHQVAFQTPSNKLRKQKASPRPRKRKNNNESQSLAGACILWDDGRRKSSRHGERPLLGRIHEKESCHANTNQHKENQHELANNGTKIYSRKTKPWTSDEEESLRAAVKLHGTGNDSWRLIQETITVFQDRTVPCIRRKWAYMEEKSAQERER